MKWYLKVLRQCADFRGRARRREYWMFTLFGFIFAMAALILDNVWGLTIGSTRYGLFYIFYALAVCIPSLAVSVRRLHDIGKSGWMLLVGLIPFIGGIWLFVLFCMDSQPGTNKWGPNPKEPISEENAL